MTAAAFVSLPRRVLHATHCTATLRVLWPWLFSSLTGQWQQRLVLLEYCFMFDKKATVRPVMLLSIVQLSNKR